MAGAFDVSTDGEMNYARLTYESVERDLSDVTALFLKRGERFPAGARRACLTLGRDELGLARRIAAGTLGFDIVNGRAVIRGVDAGDHCNGPAVVVF